MSGDEAWDKLGKELGPLGFGIYYLLKAFEPNYGSGETTGEKLTGWSLACNQDDDIVFLHTNGYYSGYLRYNPAPGPTLGTFKDNGFVPTGIDVKSRDSDARFMVLRLKWDESYCSKDVLVEYAKTWGGYEVTGEEKDYYIALIRAARVEQEKRRKAQKGQEEKAREEKRDFRKKMKEYRKELRDKDPEEYRERFSEEWLREELRKEHPEEAGLSSEDDHSDE